MKSHTQHDEVLFDQREREKKKEREKERALCITIST